MIGQDEEEVREALTLGSLVLLKIPACLDNSKIHSASFLFPYDSEGELKLSSTTINCQ